MRVKETKPYNKIKGLIYNFTLNPVSLPQFLTAQPLKYYIIYLYSNVSI